MFLRIPRQDRFDKTTDMIVSAAKASGAPVMYDPSGQHLTVISLSGSQLTAMDDTLERYAHEDPWFGEREEVELLQVELNFCSGLYVVSTTVEVILASDKSPNEYAIIVEQDSDLAPIYDEFKAGCFRFLKGLERLPS